MNIVETVLDEFAKTQIQNELKENKWVPEKVRSQIGVGGRSQQKCHDELNFLLFYRYSNENTQFREEEKWLEGLNSESLQDEWKSNFCK